MTEPTLTEFLLARIAEDEADARRVLESFDGQWNVQSLFVGMHIAKWDPTRVLAECEARRGIVEAHVWDTEVEAGVEFSTDCRECWQAPPCLTVRLLALPYADHPDYRQEWKP